MSPGNQVLVGCLLRVGRRGKLPLVGLKYIVLSSSGFIVNQSIISVMETINDDVDKIFIHCGFNSISNRKDISEDGFESFKDIISLIEIDIGNIYKGFFREDCR